MSKRKPFSLVIAAKRKFRGVMEQQREGEHTKLFCLGLLGEEQLGDLNDFCKKKRVSKMHLRGCREEVCCRTAHVKRVF